MRLQGKTALITGSSSGIRLAMGNCSPWGNDATLGTGSSGGQVILKQP